MKKIFFLLLFLVAMPACQAVANPDAQATQILRGDEIRESLLYFRDGRYGPLTAVSKIWHEQPVSVEGAGNWLQFSFYTQGKGFLSSIGVYDGAQEIQPFEADSADCSRAKLLLAKSGTDTYLVTGVRADNCRDAACTDMPAQNEPAPQAVTIFRLESGHGYATAAMTPVAFKKIRRQTGKEKACKADAVYSLMLGAFRTFIADENALP